MSTISMGYLHETCTKVKHAPPAKTLAPQADRLVDG